MKEHHISPPSSRPAPPAEGPATLGELKAMLLELKAETEELKAAAGGSITDVMADWVAAQYLLAARKELAAQPEGPERFALLRQIAGDTVALQRGAHWSPRLKLDREKLEFEQKKHHDTLAATQPKNGKHPDYFRPLTGPERQALVDKADEIFGLK
jgi:hypothetical protein